jgi:hypothetical protein
VREQRGAAIRERRGARGGLRRDQPARGRDIVVRVSIAEAIRAAIAGAPGARAALGAILDRRERDGRLPRRLTVAADAATVAVLRTVFSAGAVTALPADRARIDLARTGAELDAILYAALDRAPRDPRAEAAARRAALHAALAAIPTPGHPIAGELLADEVAAAAAGTGDTVALAELEGVAAAAGVVADVVTALAAVLALPAPVRTANFAARVLGDSKALVPGGERARRLGAALLAYDPATQAQVAAVHPGSYAASLAAALEVRGLVRDEATVLVHAFGPLVYGYPGDARPFDQVARHAVRGAPTALSLAALRDATLVDLPVRRITVFENQAPFLDYVERADPRRELVVFARGQATWAVIVLLRLCAGTRAPIRHAGDLDRTGVLILRSLQRRVNAVIEPWHMDVATHRRFAGAGRPIDPDERARLARMLAADAETEPCHDLLVELHATGVWIEQEVFSHVVLVPDAPHSGQD